MPRKKVNHAKNLGVLVGVTLLASLIGVLALYVHLKEVDNPPSELHEGETGPGDDRISAALWYDDPNGANWTDYISSENENITFELPNNDFPDAEVYYPIGGSPNVYVGLFNDVNHIDENLTIVDNMRTLTYVYENVSIMQPKRDDILSWSLELLYKEDSLNVTPDDVEVLQVTIGDLGVKTAYYRIYHFENENNRGMECRYLYSFFTCPDTNYEFFLSYSVIKNLSYDPNQWSDTMALEEAERVFASFECS